MIADNSYYDFYISSSTTNDETQQNLNTVQIRAENSSTFKHHFCNLRETDVISPFTNLNRVIEFFKIGISGKNKDYKCMISHNAIDDVLKVNIIYKQELFDIDKTFEFYPEEHDDNEMLKKRIAKLEKEVEHLKTMNMREFEGLIVETRESIMSCVRNIEYQPYGYAYENNKKRCDEIDECYKEFCVFKTNVCVDDGTLANTNHFKYARLAYMPPFKSYLYTLKRFDLLLRDIVKEFDALYENNRFMNTYDAYINLYTDYLTTGINNKKFMYASGISTHHVMHEIYKIAVGDEIPRDNCDLNQETLDKIISNRQYKQIIKIIFDFMKKIYIHYKAIRDA